MTTTTATAIASHHHIEPSPPPPPLHRLLAAAALATLLLSSSPASPAFASNASDDLRLQLESGLLPSTSAPAPTPTTVPKGYHNTVTGLIESVRDALGADADGEAEARVRRRADPAKERVREFVGKWRDSPLVDGTEYHEEVKAAIAELGAFYGRAGPRAAVTREVRESVLSHLQKAEATLPPAQTGVLGF